jgi:hypothetical protein
MICADLQRVELLDGVEQERLTGVGGEVAEMAVRGPLERTLGRLHRRPGAVPDQMERAEQRHAQVDARSRRAPDPR